MLDAFKDMARWNMYGALGFIVCGGIGLIWAVILAWQQGLFGIFVVLAISVPSLLVSLRTKRLEEVSRNLPSDEALQSEYRRVCESWVHKMFPDF